MAPMPISVTCDNCGKSLKVKDDWAGKRAKCPGCGSTFAVPAAAGAFAAAATPAARGGGTTFNPMAAHAAKNKRQAEAGKLSINWGLIWLGVAGLTVMVLVALFLMGPKKVWGQWEEIHEQAEYDVKDVATRGLEAHLSQIGAYNPRKPHGRPQATDVMFYRPVMVMSMPDEVDLQGASTVGPFKGKYHPKTREVEVTIEVGGGAHVAGTGGKQKTGYAIKVTGRTKNGTLTAEVDGKNAVLTYPPPSEDE
jgi:hypothetical protein